MAGPESVGEWLSAIQAVHTHLGVKREQLEPYVVDIFFDVIALYGMGKVEKEHFNQRALGTLDEDDEYKVYVVKQHQTGVPKMAAGFPVSVDEAFSGKDALLQALKLLSGDI